MDSHSAYGRSIRALSAAGVQIPWLGRLEASWAAPAVMLALGYYLAARVGFAFTLQPHPISTLWPPNALLMAALLLAPTRAWWLLLAAALPAHLLAELQSGVPTAMVLGWYASNCSEALIGASLVRALIPGALRLDSFRNAGAFLLCGGLVAPLLSSFLDAALVRLIGWGSGDYLELVRMRVFSNVLAELTVAPLILTWAAFGMAGLREAPLHRYLEAAVLFLGLTAVSLVAFDLPLDNASTAPALFYAPLPFLLWAAVRLGPAGTASALALVVVLTIWGAVHGLGPFTGGTPQQTARDMQLFLTAVSVPMLLLAVVLEERSRVAHVAREQRLQLTHLSRVAMLGQLAGGIAHELNQPLTVILSNAQAAQRFIASRNVDPEELADILRDIISADQRAGEVIRRLRPLFRRDEAQFEPLDANEVVQEVLGIVHGDLVMRGVEVVTQLAAALPPLEGDRVELQQVMLNLVLNACEAMSAGAREARRLTVRTRADEGGVQVSFADRGPGFAAEQYDRLFQPFFTTKAQGLGLGLSISRSIVIAHGGRLWGSSIQGEGASFHIFLPAGRAGAVG
ncbi:MAG TPA: MASE1 domain-containing protein [Burkholderiales bacterium]|nr:MASE1 domain-containing protein [Burkholderiales bacterium]